MKTNAFGTLPFGGDFLFCGCWVGGYNQHNAALVYDLINGCELTSKSLFFGGGHWARCIMHWKKRTSLY